MSAHLKRNIPALFVIRAGMWFMVLMPVIIPFFESNSLNIQQILTLTSIHSLAIAVMEVPSGYLADRWGRKNTILLGTILFFGGYLGFCVSTTFYSFALAQLVLGLANSFISGSDSALLYDSMLEIGQEKAYVKMEGRNYSIGNIAESLAAILGGLLASISLDLPLYLQTLIAFITIPAALFLVETSHHKNVSESHLKDLKKIITHHLKPSNPLFWLIVISAWAGVATLSMAWLAQPYFESINVPLAYYGALWALLNLSSAFSSWQAHRFYNLQGKNLMLLLLMILSIGFVLIGFTGGMIGLGIIVFHYLARGMITPILRQQIQDQTASHSRATVMSLRSLIIRVFYAISAPLIGWVAKEQGISNAMICLGAGLFILMIISFITFQRKEKTLQKTVL